MVAQAAARAEQKAALAPQPLSLEFRVRAAQTLRERDPERFSKLLNTTLAELRGGQDWVLGPGVLQALVELAPADTVALLPHLRAGSAPLLIALLARAGHKTEALALFRGTASKFAEPLTAADALWLVRMHRRKSRSRITSA